jgi:hypothetical protein
LCGSKDSPQRRGSHGKVNPLHHPGLFLPGENDLSPRRIQGSLWIQDLSSLRMPHPNLFPSCFRRPLRNLLVFTIRPWHRDILRSIRKEAKLFFFDWSSLPDQGNRFENLMAVSLIRIVARFTEMGLGVFEVMYIRDKEKREVDFVLIKNNRPMALFETKEGDSEISPSGRYFGKRLGIPLYQIVHRFGRCEAFPDNCFKIPASKFLMLTV